MIFEGSRPDLRRIYRRALRQRAMFKDFPGNPYPGKFFWTLPGVEFTIIAAPSVHGKSFFVLVFSFFRFVFFVALLTSCFVSSFRSAFLRLFVYWFYFWLVFVRLLFVSLFVLLTCFFVWYFFDWFVCVLACCFVSLLSLCSIQLAFSSRYSLRGRSARVSCFRFSYFVNALRVSRAVTRLTVYRPHRILKRSPETGLN